MLLLPPNRFIRVPHRLLESPKPGLLPILFNRGCPLRNLIVAPTLTPNLPTVPPNSMSTILLPQLYIPPHTFHYHLLNLVVRTLNIPLMALLLKLVPLMRSLWGVLSIPCVALKFNVPTVPSIYLLTLLVNLLRQTLLLLHLLLTLWNILTAHLASTDVSPTPSLPCFTVRSILLGCRNILVPRPLLLRPTSSIRVGSSVCRTNSPTPAAQSTILTPLPYSLWMTLRIWPLCMFM